MTLSRRRELAEAPEGTGQVFKELAQVATVKYSLRIEREEVFARTFTGIDRHMLDQKMLSGKIAPLEGDLRPYSGTSSPPKHLTLALEDGRRFDFTIVEHETETGDYRIQGLGSFDITRAR